MAGRHGAAKDGLENGSGACPDAKEPFGVPRQTLSGDELSRSSENRLVQLLAATASTLSSFQPETSSCPGCCKSSSFVVGDAGKIGRRLPSPRDAKPDLGVVRLQAICGNRTCPLPSLKPVVIALQPHPRSQLRRDTHRPSLRPRVAALPPGPPQEAQLWARASSFRLATAAIEG